MATDSKLILQELKEIKKDLKFLKEHVKDVDLVLTEHDLEALQEAEKDLKEGKTKRLI